MVINLCLLGGDSFSPCSFQMLIIRLIDILIPFIDAKGVGGLEDT